MKNHRKIVKKERDKLYKKVLKELRKSKFSIETIRWASTRFITKKLLKK